MQYLGYTYIKIIICYSFEIKFKWESYILSGSPRTPHFKMFN